MSHAAHPRPAPVPPTDDARTKASPERASRSAAEELERREAKRQARIQAGAIVARALQSREISEATAGVLIDVSKQTVNARNQGEKPWRLEDLWTMAKHPKLARVAWNVADQIQAIAGAVAPAPPDVPIDNEVLRIARFLGRLAEEADAAHAPDSEDGEAESVEEIRRINRALEQIETAARNARLARMRRLMQPQEPKQ